MIEPCKVMCPTCPFREGSEFAYLADYLTKSSLEGNGRICHSTGTSAIKGRTGKPAKMCRGARDIMLRFFHQNGFLDRPTDEAWASKARELGLDKPSRQPYQGTRMAKRVSQKTKDEFAAKLKAWREKHMMTQAEAAKRLNVKLKSIQNWEGAWTAPISSIRPFIEEKMK